MGPVPAVIGGAEWDIGKTSFFYYVCWDLDSGKVVRSGSGLYNPDCKDLFNFNASCRNS